MQKSLGNKNIRESSRNGRGRGNKSRVTEKMTRVQYKGGGGGGAIRARLEDEGKDEDIQARYNQRRLIREFSSNFKPKFYPCTVFRQPRPLPEGDLIYGWLADDYIVYHITGGVRGDNSIVYDFHALVARWTMHAKIHSLRILPYL